MSTNDRLELEIVAKNATGKGFDEIEREAAARGRKIKQLMQDSTAMGGFGEAGAAKSLKGLNHISKGFKEMLEGDILQGGAAIAKGLKHTIGAAFSSIALGAVAALGTAFAGFKFGEWIDEKLGLSDKIARAFVPPSDLKAWDETAAAIRAANEALKEYMATLEKRVKASQEFGSREIRNAQTAEAHALKMIALEEKRNAILGDKDAPRREALRTYATKTDSLDKEQEALTRQKAVLEGTANELSANAQSKWQRATDYASQVKGSSNQGDTLRLRELANAARAAQKAFEDWLKSNGPTILNNQEKLSAIPDKRAEAKAELDTRTAEINAQAASERRKAAMQEGEDAIKKYSTPASELMRPQKEKIAALQKEKQATQEKLKADQEEIDAKRQRAQDILNPKRPIPGPMERQFGTPPPADAFAEAGQLIDQGMNPRAMHAKEANDRRVRHEQDRMDKKLKNVLDVQKRRPLTKGEQAFLDGMKKEAEAQKAAKDLAALEKQARNATIKSEEHLKKLNGQISNLRDALARNLTMGGVQEEGGY